MSYRTRAEDAAFLREIKAGLSPAKNCANCDHGEEEHWFDKFTLGGPCEVPHCSCQRFVEPRKEESNAVAERG